MIAIIHHGREHHTLLGGLAVLAALTAVAASPALYAILTRRNDP